MWRCNWMYPAASGRTSRSRTRCVTCYPPMRTSPMWTMATRCVPATAVPVCSTNTTLTPAVRCVTLQRVAVYGAREVYSSLTGPIRKLNSALVAALRPANASLFVALDVVDDEVRRARYDCSYGSKLTRWWCAWHSCECQHARAVREGVLWCGRACRDRRMVGFKMHGRERDT